ncbi:hypothetical protein C7E17_23895, partial [Stenotrophomonas maltophilia]
SPELRIAALSVGEQEAYRQALQEANRLGAAQVDAGQAALVAAQVAHGDKPSEQGGNVEVRPEEPATAQPIAPATVAAAPPAVAVSPELRIAALSVGEQEAYRQALQEANRLGAAQV